MKMKLSDIVQYNEGIRTGLVLSRKKSKQTEENKYPYKSISLSNINELGFVDADDYIVYLKEEIDEKYFAQEGDILMRLSDPFTAIYVDDKLAGTLISSMFTCIRVSQNKNTSSKYISIVLNSQETKNQLRRVQSGTNIATANTKTILEINIPIVNLEKQKDIEGIWDITIQEQRLLIEFIEKKVQLLNGIINNLTNNMEGK